MADDHQQTRDKPGPLAAWQARVDADELAEDAAQRRAAERLQRLHEELAAHRAARPSGWLDRLRGVKTPPAPRGLYIWGDVGRGKSMLMDLFFADAPEPKKRRVHFNAFMLEVHERLHKRRQKERASADSIKPLAAALAGETRLLCFDEFFVTNIADAMILGRLFEALLDHGVVVVATSNRHPDDLYRDGLQRDRFLPFIDLIKRELDIIELAAEQDYRLEALRGMAVYHWPLGRHAERQLEQAFATLTEGLDPGPKELDLKGRKLPVEKSADGVGWFDFRALCDADRGAPDYLAIARGFHTVFLSDIEKLTPKRRDIAARFVTLIDSLYEHKCKLICSAEAAPEKLYPAGDGAFEFQRTVSRLMEMQSEAYLEAPHLVSGEPAAAALTKGSP